MVVWEVRLVLVVGGCGLVEIGDKRRRSTSDEFNDWQWVADTDDVLYLGLSQPKLYMQDVLHIRRLLSNWGGTYIQVSLAKLSSCSVLVVGGTSNQNSREILIWNAKDFLILEQIAIDSGLVQEATESNFASRARTRNVAADVVQLL